MYVGGGINLRIRGIGIIILALILTLTFVACDSDNGDNGTIDPNNGNNSNNGNDGQDNGEEIVYEPAFGGTLTVPISYVKTLNPLLNKDLNMFHFNKLIFEGLFDFDESLKVQPVLAEGYEINEDGRIIRIKLKENVTWHDGKAFTAEDVEFTINTLKYGATISSYRDLLSSIYKPAQPRDIQHILNIKVIDEYNIEIYFDRSYSNALESLIFPIIPKHQFVLANMEDENAYERALAMEDYIPIGTGPYQFDSYETLKNLNLTVNSYWWNGKPYIKNITGKILSDNEVAITSFEAMQTDIALALGPDWDKYSQEGEKKVYPFKSQNYVFLGFNFADPLFQGEKGNVIRKAIAYGLNRENIIQKLYLNHGTAVDVPIPPQSWLISDTANTYSHNIEKAKELLRKSGWVDTNNDGILEDESGNTLTIHLLTNSYKETRRNTAYMIVDDLKKVGIEVIIDKVLEGEKNVNLDNITEADMENQWQAVVKKIAERDYEMTLLEYQLSYIPDLAFLYHSAAIQTGTNITSYQNEEMDTLINAAFSASSLEQKKEIYEQIHALIVEDLPFVSLYFKDSALLVQDRIKGDIKPQSFNIYYNISEWFIPKELQK